MHNPIQNAYNPGLVPTVIIILKFRVVLEQILSVKKGPNILYLKTAGTLYIQDGRLKIQTYPLHHFTKWFLGGLRQYLFTP